jgi:tetratricopeptide (TPR) repeat protein
VTGKHEKALADFDKALQMQPDEKRVLVGRAMCYANLGQYDKAEKDLSDFLIARPDQALNTLWRRSLIYLADQKYQQALDDTERVLTAAPDNLSAQAAHAAALAGLGRTQEAMIEYNKVLLKAPTDADNLAGRAELFVAAKDYNNALIDLNGAIRSRPLFQRALRERAFVEGRLGQVEPAELDLQAASTCSPFAF